MTEEAPAIRIMRMFIEGASEGNPDLRRLLELSVLRVARKVSRRPSEGFTHSRPVFGLDHIVDWLKAALVNDAPWLRNVDDKGRPKKLMKFGTLDAMLREADKDMRRRVGNALRSELPDGAEEIVATIEGGYSIVRMLTAESLDAETSEMQHCIGQGAYDDRVEDGKTLLLSLRDGNGKAHATIEVVDGLVDQVQGKQNKPPKAKYIPPLISYFRQTDYDWSLFGDGTEGFVVDIDGAIHFNDNLPDELHAHGALVLRKVAQMPSLATATTDITVHCLSGEQPPSRLEAGRDIALIGPGFTTCPELVLQGELSLDHTKITALPEGLSVSELDVRSTPLASLPEDFRCAGSLAFKFTAMTALPRTLWNVEGDKVSSNGSVDLLGSPVCDLGGLNNVNGSLRLAGTKMKVLPKDFRVTGDLDVGELKKIVIGERVSANRLSAAVTESITFLGDVLEVGDINLVNCGVSFPSVVRSSKSVTLVRCTVDAMPERVECLERFDLAGSSSNGFPNIIHSKQLWIADMRSTKWADPMTVLEGDIKVEVIALRDSRISIGDRVEATSVAVFPSAQRYVEMPVDDARTYLGQHAGERQNSLDLFAEGRGVNVEYDVFGYLPGAVENKVGKDGSLFGFGLPR